MTLRRPSPRSIISGIIPTLSAPMNMAAQLYSRNDSAAPGSSAAPSSGASGQGLTLVHFSAQLEPCLSQESTQPTLNTPGIPLTRATQPLREPPIPCRALKLR